MRGDALALLAVLALAACDKPKAPVTEHAAKAPAAPAPKPAAPPTEPKAKIAADLAERVGKPVKIDRVVHERRDGHEVVCGMYTQDPPERFQGQIVRQGFGAVDGKLTSPFAPGGNPAGDCLSQHFGAPHE